MSIKDTIPVQVPLHIRKFCHSVCTVAQSCKSCVCTDRTYFLIPLPLSTTGAITPLWFYNGGTDSFYLRIRFVGVDPSFENDLCLFPSKFALSPPPSPRVYTYFMLGGTRRLGRRAACLLDKRNSCKIPLLWPYVI